MSENRAKWEFPYAADQIVKAAKEKRKSHGAKLKWWTEQKTKVIGEIKAGGIEFDDSLASGTPKFSTSNYSRDTSVTVRADLLRDLNECNMKIRAHYNAAKEYDGWIEVLQSQGSTMVALTQADWLYFFSKTVELNEPEEDGELTVDAVNALVQKAA